MKNWIAVVACTGWFNLASAQETRPYLMVSIGDSITAAFAANTNAAPGIGTRVLRTPTDHKDTLSWSSGQAIGSHAARLGQYLQKTESAPLVVKNFARTGARMSDLDRQADQVLEEWKSAKYRAIRYMTFLIGANDACSKPAAGGRTDEELQAQLEGFFAKIATIRQTEPIRILVSAIPRIPDLELPEISMQTTVGSVTCHKMHLKITPLCKGLLDWSSSDEYRDRVRVVETMNSQIQKTVAKVAGLYPQLELHYAPEFGQAAIRVTDLAADCFHPNEQGQAKLAELLWGALPWFRSE